MTKKRNFEEANNEVAVKFMSLANEQKKNTKKEPKTDDKKQKKKLHSFLMDPYILQMLQRYARIRNVSITDIVNTAIFQYMKRNPPKEEEYKAFAELNDIKF